MQSININILNPKALELLKNLADLNLISFETKTENNFKSVTEKMRNQKNTPSLEDITKEVEFIRSKRYDK